MSTFNRHYNPDWLSDDGLVANFVARQSEFAFLRDELARAPREGSVQHYLLFGPRGSGKTTLLKRLAVAIRRDDDINDHLIALSFPEELYQVKNLSDFWWATCDALADELDHRGQTDQADRLIQAAGSAKNGTTGDDPLADAGLKLLLDACRDLERRPVLLVDNLDLVFRRIDKSGRKLKNPESPAYWALREALSTTTSPIVIGGSVRLSEPFTDYDKAFYDFFISKRLGRLSREDVRQVLERMAEAEGEPEVKHRLHARPNRIDALHELTGGNLRALGFIFELLRQGANSRVAEDFERLMDLTTPYYKARFEELSEQAQVVMHALAIRPPGDGKRLRFGHTAAEIGAHAGLPTGTVSAQMDVLEREGLVEKSAAEARTQYRIAEQLFRLWLQMRSTRRIRQNVIWLTEFLEAMYDLDELQACMRRGSDTSGLAEARFSFAMADMSRAAEWRRGLAAHGADCLMQHLRNGGDKIDEYLPADDLPEDLATIVGMRERLGQLKGGDLSGDEQDALLGSLELHLDQKKGSVEALCVTSTAGKEAARLRPLLDAERRRLLHEGMSEADLTLLFKKRARGHLPLPDLTPPDAENAVLGETDPASLRAMIWRLLGTREIVKFASDEAAQKWLDWGREHAAGADSAAWAKVAGNMRRSGHLAAAEEALNHAFSRGESSCAWHERGTLLSRTGGDLSEAEGAYRKAIELDPADSWAWTGLAFHLAFKLNRPGEAAAAYGRAIELDSANFRSWGGLAFLLANKLNRPDDAEEAYRKAIKLEPANSLLWRGLGLLLAHKLNRPDDAEAAYRKAIELDPAASGVWRALGDLQAGKLDRPGDAEATFRKAIELDRANSWVWGSLGQLLADKLDRPDDAEAAYREAIKLDPANSLVWHGLGKLLADKLDRPDDAEAAYREAIKLDPANSWVWDSLGDLLTDKLNRPDDAETAYRKAIEIDPAYSQLRWKSLGILLAGKLNRPDDAEAAFLKAIELDPADTWAWDNLGILLADKLNRPDAAEVAFRKAIELDPADSGAWFNLGILLADKLDRRDDAEAAYRKVVELDPANSWAWFSLSVLLDERNCLDEASAAFARGVELAPEADLFWRIRRDELQARRYSGAARACLNTGNPAALRDALERLLAEAGDIAGALVSKPFVEEFLAPVLADGQGAAVLEVLRALGYDKHARPLLLALEAAIENQPDKLANLEPEISAAAQRMFERLTGRTLAAPKPAPRRKRGA